MTTLELLPLVLSDETTVPRPSWSLHLALFTQVCQLCQVIVYMVLTNKARMIAVFTLLVPLSPRAGRLMKPKPTTFTAVIRKKSNATSCFRRVELRKFDAKMYKTKVR